jgi:hypothetical protein
MWLRKNPGPTKRYKTYTSSMHILQFQGKDGRGEKKPIAELRKEVERIAKEGSRMSIPREAFSGPTNAKKPQPRGSVLRPESSKVDDESHPEEKGAKKKERKNSRTAAA